MEVIENIPTFFDPLTGSGGVLQVFALCLGNSKINSDDKLILKESPFLKGKNLTEKMMLFLENQEIFYQKEDLKTFHKDKMIISAFEYRKEDRFYMIAMFQRGYIFLLSLYNVAKEPNEQESKIIGNILQSIELLSDGD